MALPLAVPIVWAIARSFLWRRMATAGAQQTARSVMGQRVFANPGTQRAAQSALRRQGGQATMGPHPVSPLMRPMNIRGRQMTPLNPTRRVAALELEAAAVGGATNALLRNAKQPVGGAPVSTETIEVDNPYELPPSSYYGPSAPFEPVNPYQPTQPLPPAQYEKPPAPRPSIDPSSRAGAWTGSSPGMEQQRPAAPAAPAAPAQPTGPDPVATAAQDARVDVAGIQRQYQNILRELSGMYQLAETEQEKERLRYMLADIEAQRDAGLAAIESGYAKTVADIRARGVTAGAEGAQRAERYGSQIQGFATGLEGRLIDQQAAQVAANRGLGSGGDSAMNEWVGLINSMAPAQQQYTQNMSDINVEGINWLGDVTASQGQAQAADLTRLAAATRSTGTMSHMDRVADRIERERAEQRAALMQIMMASASAQQSGGQFNATQAAREAEYQRALEQQGIADAEGMRNQIWTLGLEFGYSPEQVGNFIGRPLTPEEVKIVNDANAYWTQQQIRNNPPSNPSGSPYNYALDPSYNPRT